MNLSNEQLTKYYEMTNDNQHGLLLEEIASDFKMSRYEGMLKSINNIHQIEGCLENDLLQVRNRIKVDILGELAHILSDNDYNALRSTM